MKLNPTLFCIAAAITAALFLDCLPASAAQPAPTGEVQPVTLFTVITSDSAETQFMALILATQSLRQGAQVRILLCDRAGELALQGKTFATLEPLDRSPRDLLEGLIKAGARVDVCAIFLPNRPEQREDLIPGIGIARPDEIAAYMLQDGVRYFSF